MTFGKRQLLVGALVVALGAAVYLNWQFSAVQPESVTETAASDTKELGQTVYVNTELTGQTAKKTDTDKAKNDEKQTSDSNQQTSGTDKKTDVKETAAAVNKPTEQQEYFTLERQHRQSARDDAVAALTEMMEAADTSENARKEAVSAIEKLSAVIKAESDMEAEIKTKGFADCLVSVNNDNCTVIVPSEGLNEATAVTIKDIVNRQAGIDFDKITITGR